MKLLGVAVLVAVLAAIKGPAREVPPPSIQPALATQNSDSAAILVPTGQTLVLEETTELRSKGPIRVDGTIVGKTRAPDAINKDGVQISLVSDTIIIVTGRVLGGDGALSSAAAPSVENCHLAGGNGGDVILDAPVVVVNGMVVGGRGGDSGPNAKGGDGGSVEVIGWLVATRNDPHLNPNDAEYAAQCASIGFGVIGGAAGGHTHPQSLSLEIPAGAGGNGGNVRCTPHSVFPSEAVHARLLEFGLAPNGAADHRPEGPVSAWMSCQTGSAGVGPTPNTGGAATNGTAGAHGTQSAPAGQTGATGGNGGHAAAGNGTSGGPGQNCCPNPGGTGGKGGPGGGAYGAPGGEGGRGGDGYWDTVNLTFLGPGGDGGGGGRGGNAASGSGGNGGNGGPSEGAGGGFGNAGVTEPGTGGPGKRGGDGVTTGATGGTGGGGTAFPGGNGAPGSAGAGC